MNEASRGGISIDVGWSVGWCSRESVVYVRGWWWCMCVKKAVRCDEIVAEIKRARERVSGVSRLLVRRRRRPELQAWPPLFPSFVSSPQRPNPGAPTPANMYLVQLAISRSTCFRQYLSSSWPLSQEKT
ncbi:unnamed protein product [Caenorhabditis auriculariae]|uniref:Uncharacterized protein n=1 Tax=Caenorhabditis auriculariae TaxID=2777116 RepID=A0A8S1GPK6_9PELO|nr:unnamed protein product [Caenorhabditis auriculariae]